MSEPKNLVERLTACADYFEKFYGRTKTVEHIREAAAELSALRSRCAELEAELDLFSDQSNNFQDRLMEAEAARDEAVERATRAGKMLANAAYNIHQRGHVDADTLRSLKSAQEDFDAALRPTPNNETLS